MAQSQQLRFDKLTTGLQATHLPREGLSPARQSNPTSPRHSIKTPQRIVAPGDELLLYTMTIEERGRERGRERGGGREIGGGMDGLRDIRLMACAGILACGCWWVGIRVWTCVRVCSRASGRTTHLYVFDELFS